MNTFEKRQKVADRKFVDRVCYVLMVVGGVCVISAVVIRLLWMKIFDIAFSGKALQAMDVNYQVTKALVNFAMYNIPLTLGIFGGVCVVGALLLPFIHLVSEGLSWSGRKLLSLRRAKHAR
ncbi:hypothetical protein [Serratia odorifera]|uniref:Uncharacterized protein n=2 Tax=Serratia odorifera TaxID=618 RepID=D4EA33_SEROD|nr:hypothetical protein [Serratia odorifera]EFE93301.1 hypothetical protein HMPREF0758_5033 [Serratia odorifera DSM 4582]PNK88318.1 hypothetical protein CEQ31_000620 [Serratia odorifera]RII73948.1 hypothetical protein DX901_00865 [Serratia odorifera]VDZ51131.1 Uncharacterised protein [Serratia odorifera]